MVPLFLITHHLHQNLQKYLLILPGSASHPRFQSSSSHRGEHTVPATPTWMGRRWWGAAAAHGWGREGNSALPFPEEFSQVWTSYLLLRFHPLTVLLGSSCVPGSEALCQVMWLRAVNDTVQTQKVDLDCAEIGDLGSVVLTMTEKVNI